jgi:non-homologous end joining protein Ku
MLKQKEAGMAVLREHAAPRPQNVMNVMDALTPSPKKEAGAPAARSPRPARAVDDQSD